MEELRMARARYEDDATMVICVKDHKGSLPAKLVAKGRILAQLILWVDIIRPHYVAADPDTVWVFPSPSGGKLQHFSRMLSALTNVPTATAVRKTLVTKSVGLSADERTSLAQSMSHSLATAEKYYKGQERARSKKGYDLVGSLMHIPLPEALKKKRQRFTEEQTQIIKNYFADVIKNKDKTPSPSTLEQFLSEYRTQFPGRNRGDIYSKIRNIKGRDKNK